MSARGSRKSRSIRLGVHTSIAGGISKSVERAAALKCTTMQIFSHNPRQWQKSRIPEREVERFRTLRKRCEIRPIFIHVSYLINLAALSKTILNRSIDLLSYELATADTLGVEYVILHTGSAAGENQQSARNRAAESILRAVGSGRYAARLVLENTAGERGDITSSVTALAEIIDRCGNDRIGGICIDTCHAFSSGYDISVPEGTNKLVSEIDEYIGLDRLKLIHLNDSKRPLGSGVDRHEHIGAGHIRLTGFQTFLSDRRIRNVPMVLETPKESDDDDKKNLRKVYRLLA
jgi:deoxyribonuclease-4